MNDIRVTYYLGAGASANAVPMVSQIRDYYDSFFLFIKKKIDEIKWGSNTMKLNTIAEFENITLNLKEHYTPDIYAKKLWLQEENPKLEHLKFYLSLFFYWIENKYSPLDIDFNSTSFNHVKGGIDERYDPFLATLLERTLNEYLRFPPRINIVTWNYDTQLETAYSKFSKTAEYEKIRNGLCIFPKPADQNYLSNLSRLIKMNGCSRLFFSNKKHEVVSVFKQPNDENIPSKWLVELSHKIKTPRADWGMPLINFAWEVDNPASIETIKEVEDIFSKTQILVIIGYSFPTFNRNVDRSLFKCLPEDCIVYYQALKSDVHDLIDKLKSIKHLTNEVRPVFNLDQFHIPIEL